MAACGFIPGASLSIQSQSRTCRGAMPCVITCGKFFSSQSCSSRNSSGENSSVSELSGFSGISSWTKRSTHKSSNLERDRTLQLVLELLLELDAFHFGFHRGRQRHRECHRLRDRKVALAHQLELLLCLDELSPLVHQIGGAVNLFCLRLALEKRLA